MTSFESAAGSIAIFSQASYGRFAGIAEAFGAVVQRPNLGSRSIEAEETGMDSVERLLRTADAFLVVGNAVPLGQIPHLLRLFHDRIDAGARALLIPETPLLGGEDEDLTSNKPLLSRYYIEATSIKIVGPEGERLNVEFTEFAPNSDLLNGIDRVVAHGPFALKYWGESLPVLKGAAGHWSVDMADDYPAGWNGRDLSCMAIWYGGGGGAVLVDSGATLIDPVDVLAGHVYGIEKNPRLASNVVRFLLQSVIESPFRQPPREAISLIEINLNDLMRGVLDQRFGDHWFDRAVPNDIRTRIEGKRKKEHAPFVRAAYFDLSDFKRIFENNWALFSERFKAVDCSGDATEALAFFKRLTELRNIASHPTRTYVGQYQFTSEDRRFLQTVLSMCIRLAAPFSGSGRA